MYLYTYVIITIFCDFCQCSGEKIAFLFKKNNVPNEYIFTKTDSTLRQKTPILSPFFGENIFKIITSVPGLQPSPPLQGHGDRPLLPAAPRPAVLAGEAEALRGQGHHHGRRHAALLQRPVSKVKPLCLKINVRILVFTDLGQFFKETNGNVFEDQL
jgi:hypothetical protein